MSGKGPYLVRMVRKVDLSSNYVELDLEAPEIAADVRPGQFVHLRLPTSGALLRRPLSLAGVRGNLITILMKKVGLFTGELGERKEGTVIDVLGPLGHGFDFEDDRAPRSVLAAGGYGAAPLGFLAERLHARHPKKSISLLVGAKTREDLVWGDAIGRLEWLEYETATEDGSSGRKGTVLDLMRERIGTESDVSLYSCGPMGMLREVWRAWPKLRSQVSVENQMGCGVGVCLGCVVPVKPAYGGGSYARVCREGPVFNASEVDWDLCMEAR
jgi:dihydroorotate dehydrogenase electron transfer subunit